MKKLLIAFVALVCMATLARAQDAKAGQAKAAMCIGCHGIVGYQASFPEIHKVPMISGQAPKYIVVALNSYKKGERKHPTMRAIAASLSDQDIADLAAFYGEQTKPPGDAAALAPAPEVAELVKKANCVSCHGDNFSKPIDGYPKLAGQHADYLYTALKAYQTVDNPQVGRTNPVMMGMAQPFTHAQLKALAAYLAALPGELQTVPQSRFK